MRFILQILVRKNNVIGILFSLLKILSVIEH
nr:MAG TPA: hypothetical protein [Caudoviricetes sp.]